MFKLASRLDGDGNGLWLPAIQMLTGLDTIAPGLVEDDHDIDWVDTLTGAKGDERTVELNSLGCAVTRLDR